MLTPVFSISQDDKFLTISIKAPYAKVSEAEIYIDDCDFKFYAKPYYLRLNLPKPIHEDAQGSAQYEAGSGHFNVRVAKVNPGEHFDGLDLLTKLLAPSGQASATGPLIEVIDSADNADTEEDFDWQIEQVPYTEPELTTDGPKYGFANQKCGVLKRLQEELCGIIDLKNADDVTISQRKEMRHSQEQEMFSEDHYLADLFDNPIIEELVDFIPEWNSEYEQLQRNESVDNSVFFTKDENEKMLKLPRKEYLLDVQEKQSAFFGLVDIIFAYAYNHRTTQGESSVESAWTLCKVSSTLSWLEVFTSLNEAVITSYRRSLTFPLFRNWKLANAVFMDVKKIFAIGRKRLLKSLLEIHSMLIDTEQRYVLNDLYITDYCVWIQHASDKQIASLSKSLNKVNIEKNDIGFDLDLIEKAGLLALEEGDTVGEATNAMTALTLNSQRKASFQNDVLPYKTNATNNSGSETDSSETKSSGESGDSYSIKEASDVDNSELFQYQSDDEDEDNIPSIPLK